MRSLRDDVHRAVVGSAEGNWGYIRGGGVTLGFSIVYTAPGGPSSSKGDGLCFFWWVLLAQLVLLLWWEGNQFVAVWELVAFESGTQTRQVFRQYPFLCKYILSIVPSCRGRIFLRHKHTSISKQVRFVLLVQKRGE
ncbi:unnamed protein product, partial [Laminaria digitata]